MRTRSKVIRAATAGAVALAVLSGCSSSPSGSGAKAGGLILNVYTGASGTFIENWNPFSPTGLTDVQGMIYESLFFFNALKPLGTKPEPVLGESYSWNAAGTRLTVKVRDGITWSDGKPFTAADVAFTFNLIHSKPALNTSGNAPKARVVDARTVVLTFAKPSFVDGPSVLGRTWIVPEHIWKAIADPEKNINKNPVGTGPLTADSFTPQSYTFKRNTAFRDAAKLAVDGLRVYSLSGNQAATDKLLAGQLDWAGIFIPNMRKVLATKPKLSYSVTSANPQTVLITCSNAELGCTGPQTDVAVRRAVSAAIDREQINQLAYYGEAKPVSPTFGLSDRDAAYIAPEFSKTLPMKADVAGAKRILESDGWRLGADGIYAKQGRRLSLKVQVTSGYTDYIATLDAMTQQLKKAGIEIVPQQLANAANESSQGLGKFQVAISNLFQGPAADPYYIYSGFFGSSGTAPVGTSVNPYGNVSRFHNAAVDAAITEAAGTQSPQVKAAAYAKIQKVIVEQIPYIPVLRNVGFAEFNNQRVTGWPTIDDPYASSSPGSVPDNAQVLMRLKPAGPK
jgi:peptide/nickel transport system substrate-binding protein